MKYEMNAGLEVHVELATDTKIFCGCSTRFGGEGNTQVCPVCSGMPGALPVLNGKVVDHAIRTGLALNCQISRDNMFDRKNYFYPDLPKAYQVSQLYQPICKDGHLDIQVEGQTKRIGIHDIHMEEDAGKLTHDPWQDCTLVDFNRCGVPLLEIVSEPDFSSAEEVVAYVQQMREILVYIGVSDCKMQEGSMRVDLNISVRPTGSDSMGTRTEMKNMSSIKAIGRAVTGEAARQIELLEAGGEVVQQTRRWDENRDASYAMRGKENAHDYRYFPEPDLMPLHIDEDWIERIRESMPELAEQKRQRYMQDFRLPEYDARVLTSEKVWADLFERTARLSGQPKEASNIVMGEVMRLYGDNDIQPDELSISPQKLADIIGMVKQGSINRGVSKQLVEQVFHNGVDPAQYVQTHGLSMLQDSGEIETAVDAALKQNPQPVLDYAAGKTKAFGFLMGKAMQQLGGKADPQKVREILREKLGRRE